MALVTLHDPYEWFDPEIGRSGVLIHTSALDAPRVFKSSGGNWNDVWKEVDARKELVKPS